MSRDKFIGWSLLAVSISVIILYIMLLWFPMWKGIDLVMIKLTGTVVVVGVFAVLGWIGYTLATTPPPKPINEIEKELEEELKKLEQEVEGTRKQENKSKAIEKGSGEEAGM